MPERSSNAIWEGSTKDGNGTVILGRGILNASYSYASRFSDGQGTNPEELLAGALASSFSMALATALENEQWVTRRIISTAKITMVQTNSDMKIKRIHINTQAEVADVEQEQFETMCRRVLNENVISKVLAGIPIKLSAELNHSEDITL